MMEDSKFFQRGLKRPTIRRRSQGYSLKRVYFNNGLCRIWESKVSCLHVYESS